MNLRRALLLFTLWTLAAVRLPAIYVWFTSAPSPVESGQGYYVEAYSFSYNESGVSLSLYKNGGWFASGGGWSDAVAGGWTSDAGPQTVSYMAEAYDPYEGGVWDWASVTVNGTPPPANNPPNAWVEVDGYGSTATVTRPYGGTISITVRYKAGDSDGNLARIRPQVWHPGTGLFTNDGGAWTGQGGGYGEVVRTVTLDRNGDWYFWADAEDTNNVFVNSGAWGDAFRLTVVEGAPPNVPPVITLLSPAAQTITVGTALTLSSHATDANGNLTHHHLDIQRPDGSWNWQGGFANGEPYNGGPVGSAADSTRTAAFTFDQAGTWQVRSWANDSNNANLHSATVAITVNAAPDTTPPGSPQNLAVSGLTSSSFTLSWSAPAGEAATGYRVRLNGGTPVAVSVLSYTFTGLAAGASYSAEVSARDAAGNWSVGWVGAGATTGGSGGGTVTAQSLWRDVDGDGILDEIVPPNTAGFDYYVNTWYTENIYYASFPINNYWLDWTAVIDGAGFFNFFSSLWSGIIFWIEYETHFDLVLSVLVQANEPLAIYRDTSGSHEVNHTTWGAPILNLPNGFPAAGTQYLNWPLPGPNDLPGVQYFLVKKGLPVGTAQLTDSFGVSLGSAIPGSVLNVLLPGNNHLVVTARDLLGRVLTVGHNGVVFSVKNALGQLLNLPNNGILDVLDIGIDQTGTWQIGMKLGSQTDAQTMWFNVNVTASQRMLLVDANNDGLINSADATLLDAAQAPNASGDSLESGTEYLFVDDQMSNGLWDKDDSAKPIGHTSDDDLQELKTALNPNSGWAWFEHPAIDRLTFYKTKACTAADAIAFPWNLSNNNPLPGTIYVRAESAFAGQVEGNLVLKHGTQDKSQTYAESRVRLTIVKGLGDAKFFHACRDYILENNTNFYARQSNYSGETMRSVVMRQEATTMKALDTYYRSPKLRGIEAVISAFPEQSVIINGNFNEGLTLNGLVFEDTKCIGRLISGGALDTNMSQDSTQTTAEFAKPEYYYVAQSGNGAFTFAQGEVPLQAGYQEALGGMYRDYAGADAHAANMIGQALVGDKKMIFVNMTNVGVDPSGTTGNGVVTFAAAAEASGATDISLLDGGTSCALGYKDPSGVLVKQFMGYKHTGALDKYYIHSYLMFNSSKPRAN